MFDLFICWVVTNRKGLSHCCWGPTDLFLDLSVTRRSVVSGLSPRIKYHHGPAHPHLATSSVSHQGLFSMVSTGFLCNMCLCSSSTKPSLIGVVWEDILASAAALWVMRHVCPGPHDIIVKLRETKIFRNLLELRLVFQHSYTTLAPL